MMEKTEPRTPTDLRNTLAADPTVMALWKSLTPIARRDFIFWIESAKQPETRKRRIDGLGSRLVSGKRRPCCFALVPMNFYKALAGTAKAKALWKKLTPDEKRDFIGWIDETKESEARGIRIEKACIMLASGKRHP